MASQYLSDYMKQTRTDAAGSQNALFESGKNATANYLGGYGGANVHDFADSLTQWGKGQSPLLRTMTQGELALGAGLTQAAGIDQEINKRQDAERGFLTQQFNEADKPTLSQADIERQQGMAADQAAAQARQMVQNLREHLGMAGVQGGAATGLASRIEMARMGQITGANRDLKILKAQTDAQDRREKYNRALGLADFRSKGPSELLLSQLNELAGVRLAEKDLEYGKWMADDAAKAGKSAGMLGMAGQVAGGLLGLL